MVSNRPPAAAHASRSAKGTDRFMRAPAYVGEERVAAGAAVGGNGDHVAETLDSGKFGGEGELDQA